MPEFPQTSPKKLFWRSHKKTSCVFFLKRRKSQIQTYFDSQSHSSHNENKGVEKSVPEFSRIFPGFSKILPGFSTN